MSERALLTIDLSADLGEHDGDGFAADDALLDAVSSASIACGAHAGSPAVMDRTVRSSAARNIAIGAHPSYPDREGFGRRVIEIDPASLAQSITEQISALRDCCARSGAALRYVKPHGALYNRATRDHSLAKLIARCVIELDPALVVLTLSGSALESECRAAGIAVAREAFVDRAYMADGSLAPRDMKGSVLHDKAIAASRALSIARGEDIETLDGTSITIDAESLCVHGDSPGALEMVRQARRALERAGFTIRAFA